MLIQKRANQEKGFLFLFSVVSILLCCVFIEKPAYANSNKKIESRTSELYDFENNDSFNENRGKESILEEDLELNNVDFLNTENYLIESSLDSFPTATRTGFYYPIGKSEFRSACGQWLARDSANGGCYFDGKYHIGVDMMANIDDPVYAVSNGTVKYKNCSTDWGPGNCAVAILHRLYDGREFLAIYGHIRTTLVVDDTVTGGREFATVGPYPNGNHLHFGIRLALTNPAPWGIMPNVSWPGTNSFIDPIYWLNNRIPSPNRDRYETDDGAADAKQLSLNATQSRSIHVAGNTDWITFTLTQRKTVRIETNGYVGDTVMWLYGPNSSSTLIEYDDDSGYDYFSLIEQTLDPGTYYIKIKDYGNTGPIPGYKLSLYEIPWIDSYESDDSAAGAKLIGGGNTGQTFEQIHSINAIGNADWAKFILKQRSKVTIETSGSVDDTEMWLYGPNSSSTLIEYDDDSGYDYFSLIEQTLDPGTYYIKIKDFLNDGIIPVYQLSLWISSQAIGRDRFEDDDRASAAKVINVAGAAQTHSIHVAGDTDWTKFTLATTKTVYIETNGYGGDTVMWLYGPNSSTTLIEYNDDKNYPYDYFSLIERILSPGTYYIKIKDYSDIGTTDFYILSVDALP